MAEAQIAVLIDHENVGLNAIQPLFDQLSDMGRMIVKRIYGDWSSSTKRDRERVLELGIEAIQSPRSGGQGKNASDIRLAIDAVDLLYNSSVDTFTIVSADTDFAPLVTKLRASGKTVVGAGPSAAVSRILVNSCDRYIFLDQITAAKPLKSDQPPMAEIDTEASLLLRAMHVSMDDDGRVVGAKLNQAMQRIDPSFNFRALGYRSFMAFLEQAEDVTVSREGPSRDVVVELSTNTITATGLVDRPSFDHWPTIDQLWGQKAPSPGDRLPGPWAADQAARAIGTGKLSISRYRTLQRLLDAFPELKSHWFRDGNWIIRY